MMMSAVDPWSRDMISEAKCWACEKDFVEGDEVRVVDAADPKLVHDREPCSRSLVKLGAS